MARQQRHWLSTIVRFSQGSGGRIGTKDGHHVSDLSSCPQESVGLIEPDKPAAPAEQPGCGLPPQVVLPLPVTAMVALLLPTPSG